LRYSEDLDFVRTNQEPLLGQIFTELRGIAAAIGLREHTRAFPTAHSDMGTIWFAADPESRTGRIRIKIETNTKESTPFQKRIGITYSVDSPWWSGSAPPLRD
jgi:hypothetical protein